MLKIVAAATFTAAAVATAAVDYSSIKPIVNFDEGNQQVKDSDTPCCATPCTVRNLTQILQWQSKYAPDSIYPVVVVLLFVLPLVIMALVIMPLVIIPLLMPLTQSNLLSLCCF